MNIDDNDLVGELERLKTEVLQLQRRLLGRKGRESIPVGHFEVLDFSVENTHLCLPVQRVAQVVPRPLLGVLPEAPPWVAGIMNLHAESVVVLDLKYRFWQQPSAICTTDLIIVTALGTQKIGLLVQSVSELLALNGTALSEVDANLPYAPYVLGIANTASFSTCLLGMESLLMLIDRIEEIEPQ